MEFFTKIVIACQLLTIFSKGSILDVWLTSEYNLGFRFGFLSAFVLYLSSFLVSGWRFLQFYLLLCLTVLLFTSPHLSWIRSFLILTLAPCLSFTFINHSIKESNSFMSCFAHFCLILYHFLEKLSFDKQWWFLHWFSAIWCKVFQIHRKFYFLSGLHQEYWNGCILVRLMFI